MQLAVLNVPRLALAAAAAGVWVTASGILMAAAFGYREMKVAFDAVGLAIPQGIGPMVTHTLVRFAFGATLVTLYAILVRVGTPVQAGVAAAGFAWVLGILLPYTVIAEWGLLPWPVVAKVCAWGAGEFIVAAVIARSLYR